MTPGNMIEKTVSRVLEKFGSLPYPFRVHTLDRETIPVGEGEPVFDIHIRNERGLSALTSLNKLLIVEAYIQGHLDFEGDLVKASALSIMLEDNNWWIRIWRHLQPLLMGREKLNPQWIAKHYDSGNIQLFAADQDYNTYTPGIYTHDGDTLEAGAERKLEFAFNNLELKTNDGLLEIGCGWGGMMRYCARRGVIVTGITLSENQKAYCEKLIEENQLIAEVHYQDFFTYRPEEKYDALSIMGVIEDLSDYPRVMKQIATFIKPGGKVYLDFASATALGGTSSFITKYVWPGKFRLVDMTQFIEAVRSSLFEIVAIHNDRYNYYYWSKGVYERWREKKDEILKVTNDQLWRTFDALFASVAAVMIRPQYDITAYRVVLEFPKDRVF